AVQTAEYDAASLPAWSPNGRSVAYVRFDHEIWLINIDGTNLHRIIAPGTDPDWSPDGTKLAYGGPGDTVMIANAGAGNPRVLTNGTAVAWRPNGSELAFVEQGGLWTIGLDGQKRRRLITNGTEPDWSPDGKRLVFIRNVGRLDAELVVADADGGNER